MADEELSVEPESSPSAVQGAEQGPLVSVTFQRNPAQKQKYLESEPQALGITQVGLSLFQISWTVIIVAHDLIHGDTAIPIIVLSLLVIIAGSLAIAAQNLHLPTLRACLGMQVVACVASLFNMTIDVVTLGDHRIVSQCWYHHQWPYDQHQNGTDWCNKVESAYTHIYAGLTLIQAALVAISATLAAYCCKVINCCSPGPKMPVITVQAPPTQQ